MKKNDIKALCFVENERLYDKICAGEYYVFREWTFFG